MTPVEKVHERDPVFRKALEEIKACAECALLQGPLSRRNALREIAHAAQAATSTVYRVEDDGEGGLRCRDCADSDGFCCNDPKGRNCGFPEGHPLHRAEPFRPGRAST